MQFGDCLYRLIQKMWKANPVDVLVWLFKWDISDAFHRCNLPLSFIGKFACVVAHLPSKSTRLTCVNLLLLMVWVKSPHLFCSASETVTNNSNGYTLDPSPSFATPP